MKAIYFPYLRLFFLFFFPFPPFLYMNYNWQGRRNRSAYRIYQFGGRKTHPSKKLTNEQPGQLNQYEKTDDPTAVPTCLCWPFFPKQWLQGAPEAKP